MTKKIAVTIVIDGTGNNKNSDTSSGQQTNAARIYNMVDADLTFDFSKNLKSGSDDIMAVAKGSEGTKDAFGELFKSDVDDIKEAVNSADSYKVYLDGVGSQEDKDSLISRAESATGLGTAPRVETALDVVRKLRQVYGPDVEIEINTVGFSRGSTAAKTFVNKLSEEFSADTNVKLKDGVFFDTVASMGNPKTEIHMGMDLGFPANTDSGYKPLEIIAANEIRGSFPITPYQEKAEQIFNPGAHAQIGGGYTNDILAAGSLADAVNHLEKNGMAMKPMALSDVVRLRLYNSVIENPYLVRALLTDSRIKSEDLGKPGSNVPFAGEKQQDYEFDNFVDKRDVIDENSSLAKDPVSKNIDGLVTRLENLSSAESFNAAEEHKNNLEEKYVSTDFSVESIARQNYQAKQLPSCVKALPPELEELVRTFETQLQQIEYDPENPDNHVKFQKAIEELQVASEKFAQALDNLEDSQTLDEEGLKSLNLFQNDI